MKYSLYKRSYARYHGSMNDDAIWRKALTVWKVDRDELNRLVTEIDKTEFSRLVRVLGDLKGRVLVGGVGTSGAAAKKIVHSLCCIDRPSMFLSPGDAVHGSLGAVQPGDVVILISKGGGTAEITNLIPSIKAKRAFLVGVTENADSALGRACDLLLKIKIEKEADEFNMLATTSTMAVIVVFDAICVSLMEYTGYTREQFAIIHPSGAVGERLLAKKE